MTSSSTIFSSETSPLRRWASSDLIAPTSALVMAVPLTLATEFSGVAAMPALAAEDGDFGASEAG
ncbi:MULTISPECIES: hypothetical protein [Methylococcus]|uniref:Uncharacterized protein n=1 Tax=Methylococcus capsulatus TaxID=414 RepID=A0ABZ2F2F9_METCP|nr:MULTISPECIES: hypothetical protein [Methylococcus]